MHNTKMLINMISSLSVINLVLEPTPFDKY